MLEWQRVQGEWQYKQKDSSRKCGFGSVLGFRVWIFPLILTILNWDYSPPPSIGSVLGFRVWMFPLY